MAILAGCLGLRISEVLGLQWKDIDRLNGDLRLERAVVKQNTGEVKTHHSAKPLPLDVQLLEYSKRTSSKASSLRRTTGSSLRPTDLGTCREATAVSVRS
jgi:integrase